VNEVGDLPTRSILRVDILPEVALKYGYDAQPGGEHHPAPFSPHRNLAAVCHAGRRREPFRRRRLYHHPRQQPHQHRRQRADHRLLLESERGVASATNATDPTGQIANDAAWRTLKPATRTYALNANRAMQLGSGQCFGQPAVPTPPAAR
jgi:hypothetical protein